MGYYEFIIKVTEESKDVIINCLSEMDCLGFHERHGELLAYFLDNRDINIIRERLEFLRPLMKEAGLNDQFTFNYSYLSERDWNEPWKKKFIPINIGERLRVIPPWEEKDRTRLNIIVDPGMAFGTGHHETTRDCLILMERYSDVTEKEMFLDIGTGTGILSIGASLLDFKNVIGIDIDPLAIDASRRNAELNHIWNVNIKQTTVRDVIGQFDMIAANLMSETLIVSAPDIARLLNKVGLAILSGMLEGQDVDVIEHMQGYGLGVVERVKNNRWVSLVMKFNSSV